MKAFTAGGGLSFAIESTQYVTKTGFAEFDDVFHNTLGCVIGYGIYLVVYGLWLKLE